MFNVKIGTSEKIYTIQASENENLLSLLRANNIVVNSPCNGNGTCGKCRVKIISGALPQVSPNEARILGAKAIEEGVRLSCNYSIQSDIEIFVEDISSLAQIVTDGKQRDLVLSPIVTKEKVLLSKPELSNQTADFERCVGIVNANQMPSLDMIRSLPELIRQCDYHITKVYSNISSSAGSSSQLVTTNDVPVATNDVTATANIVSTNSTLATLNNTSVLRSVESGDTTKATYGVAIDIGTTTIAAYLMDLTTGQNLCVHSLLNPQKNYGADVISRIKHTLETQDGLEELHELIITAINDSIDAMCKKCNIARTNIYAITLVGNTTMMHFLIKVSAKNIASAPFIPAITSMLTLNAAELGIKINPYGFACVLPSVSAYIGADTVGAVLSTGMSESDDMSLLIDIGTNGEIVLGNNQKLYSCSSAAGPAFEGANIRNGIGSVTGAINTISLDSGVNYTTIGNAKPVGICGTGIVDGIAQMLDVGIIDETGRLDDDWEPTKPEHSSLLERISVVDGLNAFIINEDIAITQKDIRELQNAKAAIAAGVYVLVKQAGISFADIKNVYLAGGFGTYINIDNALKIGLIPSELKGKIQSVGNAAGQGAIEALVCSNCLAMANDISKKIKYVELSASKDFNDYYIDCMMFE